MLRSPEKWGLLLDRTETDWLGSTSFLAGSKVDSIAHTVADWTRLALSTLIALDAPLGCQAGLGHVLHRHEAGGPITLDANRICRLETDWVVKRVTSKQTLDVGSYWIARTAHAALGLLQELRQYTGDPIPLAWNPVIGSGTHAIEVYPGATLAVSRVRSLGYKGKPESQAYREVLEFLESQVTLPPDGELLEDNDDILDAALCLLAAVDFLRGKAMQPADLNAARKEGWIWVRKPAI